MKTIKFNVTTSYRNIPDSKYHSDIKKMEDLKENEPEKWLEVIKHQFNKYPLIDVKSGDVVNVPDWYYETQKNDVIEVARSFDKYKDKAGNRVPFDVEEAIRHGDIGHNEENKTMMTIKKFELVQETIKKAS